MSGAPFHSSTDSLAASRNRSGFARWAIIAWAACVATLFCFASCLAADEVAERDESFEGTVLPLLKRHCFKCHGVSKKEGQLQLHSAVRIWRGGENGTAVTANHPEQSPLWLRVSANEMPPENPLTDREKKVLHDWITAGASGLPKDEAQAEEMSRDEHWAFTQLIKPELPQVKSSEACRTSVDRFIYAELEKAGIQFSAATDKRTLIRRVAFTLTGLPPTPAEINDFLSDSSDAAIERMIDQFLASDQYGVRWGRHWLDAAGYADSNGYFNADSDRPLAYQYRDYVVRAMNADKPFDQFVREQIAGDEISGFNSETHRQAATPEMIDMLIATHYLRNGQDGSGESDGNPDEVRIDRYTALESSQQIIASSLLGLTFQCAKCHDHKFEPITQADYYQFQSVLFPAFNPDKWVKPNDRITYASVPEDYNQWRTNIDESKAKLTSLQSQLRDWSKQNRLPELIQFSDDFTLTDKLEMNWSNTIPGDDGPAGVSAITLVSQEDSDETALPAAMIGDGRLKIIEGGLSGDKWLSTRQTFDWTPETEGQWIQVSFLLVDTRVREEETSAERIAFGIALHDFNNNSDVGGGNILIDGNPAGGASVHLDYPGPDSTHAGNIGSEGYTSGKSYGVRVTHMPEQTFRLQHIVDGLPEGPTIDLKAEDLPNGSFGFEFCCGRSFQVDDVVVTTSFPKDLTEDRKAVVQAHHDELQRRLEEIKAISDQIPQLVSQEPGRIAWLTDTEPSPPDVFLLNRGEYSQPGPRVEPAPISALDDESNTMSIAPSENGSRSSGRRLAWANWVTHPNSRAASLMARVQVNRVWQQHFGTGLVSTPENLGMSGADPSNAALLDWLASEFISSGWRLKSLHRLILQSAVFQQSSEATQTGLALDPYNKLLWRYPIRRLDAEALRDAHLAICGDLDLTFGGPYVPTTRNGAAEVTVPEDRAGAFRRSIYLQQRRSQGLSLLSVFDAPTMVVNCTRRPVTTMPLQSLTLLNSEFAVKRGQSFSARLQREAGESEVDRIQLAFVLATASAASDDVVKESLSFIQSQTKLYEVTEASLVVAKDRAWSDFCQLLLASNACLYLE